VLIDRDSVDKNLRKAQQKLENLLSKL
jgi:hypothetical protein